MKPIELIGDIDEQHRLHARVPTEIPAGQVHVIVFLPGEDEAGRLWANGVASEWSADWPILGKTSTRWMTITR
jgi:hypothetical protein